MEYLILLERLDLVIDHVFLVLSEDRYRSSAFSLLLAFYKAFSTGSTSSRDVCISIHLA
jgi:hypothetical protein